MEFFYLVNHMVVESTMLNQQHLIIFFEVSLLKPIGITHSCIILNFMGSNKRNAIAKTGCPR